MEYNSARPLSLMLDEKEIKFIAGQVWSHFSREIKGKKNVSDPYLSVNLQVNCHLNMYLKIGMSICLFMTARRWSRYLYMFLSSLLPQLPDVQQNLNFCKNLRI
jgi:hypothetical protein